MNKQLKSDLFTFIGLIFWICLLCTLFYYLGARNERKSIKNRLNVIISDNTDVECELKCYILDNNKYCKDNCYH